MTSTSKSPKPKSKGRVCIFCEEGNVSVDIFGKLISRGGVTAHYFCMLFSSGLSQNGKSEKQGILGFLQTDIIKEVKRGAKLKCSYCKRNGATIGCVIRNCKKMFHLGCGRKNGTLHQYFGTFSSFCPAHRQQQDVPSDDDPNIVCSICMNTIIAKPGNDTIRAPCCSKYWYHRDCVQRYATSAGLYFFKCPLCNNKEEFQGEMLTMGIYIPDQDASWEKEPHAFQDLLERYGHCDAPVCKCAEGRKYDKEGSKWEIILCDFCGSHGSHVACNHLEKLGKHDICSGCKEVDERTREEEYLLHSPQNKKKSLELLQLELASSPESTKGSSPYPGPSNAMKKVGLPKSPTNNVKQKYGAKKGKRTACTELRHKQPKAKKTKMSSKASATVTSASARGRHSEVLSSSVSSQSSDDSSDDELPLSLKRTKLPKMALENAWDVMRRRKLESDRKIAEKKEMKKNSKTGAEHKRKKDRVKKTWTVSPKTLEDSDTDVVYDKRKSSKTREGQLRNYTKLSNKKQQLLNRRSSLAVTKTEMEAHSGSDVAKRNSRLSLCAGTSIVSGSNKCKQKKLKRESLETDKGQTTLTNWLKSKETQESPNNRNTVFLAVSGQPLRRTPRKVNKSRRPVVMEWKGKQLLIKSPRVLLRRSSSQKAGKMKPKCLEIDMTDSKGSLEWNKDIDLLSNIESDVRVTRKMIDIDPTAAVDIDPTAAKSPSKKEKHMSGNVVTARNGAKMGNLETRVNNQNEKKFALVQDVEMNIGTKPGTLNSVLQDNKVAKRNFGDKTESELSIHETQNVIDSPAKNLRARSGKDTTKIKSVNQAELVKDSGRVFEDTRECSPDKSYVTKPPFLQSDDSTDSPAKSLISRHKKGKRKAISIGDTDSCFENGSETENELTPLLQTENHFNFTILKEKRPTEKEIPTCNKDSPLIQVKKSSEFGSVTILKETFENKEIETGDSVKTSSEILERLKRYKPSILQDSPAKNLRKRSNQGDVNKETNMQKVDSDNDNCVNYNHLERLKKYQPKVGYMNSADKSPSSAGSERGTGTGETESKKETIKESRTYTVKSVNKQRDQMKKYPKVFWHFDGTRQLFNNNNNNDKSISGSCDFGCENTCPNSQSATKVANSAHDNVKPTQGHGLDYSNILGEQINELSEKLPTTVSKLYSTNELANVVGNVLEDEYQQVSQRNVLNGIKNNPGLKLRSSPRSVNKSSTTVSKANHMPDKMTVTENNKANFYPVLSKSLFSDKNVADNSYTLLNNDKEKQRNVLNGVKSSPAKKHRSSPRSVKNVSSHISDRTSMAEYYATCLNSKPKEVVMGKDGYSDDDDIIEIPMLGSVM